MGVTQSRLRRLAARSIGIVDRHLEGRPLVAAVGTPLKELANTYILLHDKGRSFGHEQRRETKQGRDAVGALARTTRGWSTHVQLHNPHFRYDEYRDRTGVPEDIMGDAEALLKLVARFAEQGIEIPDVESLQADMGQHLEAARREWGEAMQGLKDLREQQAERRQAAADLQRALVAFRKVLALEIGTAHPDYQRLRVRRASGDTNETGVEIEHHDETDVDPTPGANDTGTLIPANHGGEITEDNEEGPAAA